MIFLKYSSLVFILFLTACFPKISKQNFTLSSEKPNTFFQLQNTDTVSMYRTDIQSYGKKLSGMLVVKPHESGLKVAFLSDAGINFFSLYITKNDYVVEYCIENLNKKVILDVLVKDICMISGYIFSDLIKIENSEKCKKFTLVKDVVYVETENNQVKSMFLSDEKRNKKVICTYKNQHWQVKHTNFSLKLNLEPIQMFQNE